MNQLVLGAIDPVAFRLGPIPVAWYGILIASGIVLAYLVVQREMIQRGVDKEFLTDLLVWAVPIAIISARIYYVTFEWAYYSQHKNEIFAIWNGGIAIHGALIGSFITTYLFTKKRNMSFFKVADIAAPGILIGQIIGRWGNFINQEAHGGPVSESFLENTIIPEWIMNQMTIDGVTYHPTFLYESLWNIVGLLLILVIRRLPIRRGEIFLFYLVWYSIGRFFIEAMRTDSLYVIGELRAAQLVSVTTIVVAIVFFFIRCKTVKQQYTDA